MAGLDNLVQSEEINLWDLSYSALLELKKRYMEQIKVELDCIEAIDEELEKRNESLDGVASNKTNDLKEALETPDIPPKLKDFRKKWEEEIGLHDSIKKKIINAVNRIQKGAKEESDWSILVEFELWWKRYKCLDVNLKEHSDSEYLILEKYNRQTIYEINLSWMLWHDTNKRKNRKLAEYIEKQKNDRNMEIPKITFQKKLIYKLWEMAGLSTMSDKIAMRMYLTWNNGTYRQIVWGGNQSNSHLVFSRTKLDCNTKERGFHKIEKIYSRLWLIACS